MPDQPTDTSWALSEDIDLTALTESSVLVARVTAPGAFVLGSNPGGDRITVNSVDVDLGDDYMAYVGLMDYVLASKPEYGRTQRLAEGEI